MTSVLENGSIAFRFYRPGVRQVNVVGSFNEWHRKGLPMRPLANGWWAAEGEFEPGDYQFRYLADGVWYTDYAANGVENTKHGWNSVLVVADRTIRTGEHGTLATIGVSEDSEQVVEAVAA
jgi:1,4-alpha-glucan branching enzyme